MRIKPKLIIAFTCVTVIPYLLLVTFIFISNRLQLERNGSVAESQAHAIIHSVQQDLEYAVTAVRTWASGEDIRTFSHSSSALPRVELEETWKLDRAMDNSVSQMLMDFQTINQGRFAEIFVTDARGYVVAATNPTSDFDQGPEEDPPDGEVWWAEARREGLRIGDFEFDSSAGIYSIDISIALVQNGEFAGVLKAVYNVESLLEIIHQSDVGRTGHSVITDKDGLVVAAPNRYGRIISDPDQSLAGLVSFAQMSTGNKGYRLEDIPWVGRALVGYAPGLGYELIEWVGWNAFVVIPLEEALISIPQISWWGLVTLFLVAITIIIVTIFFSNRLSRPLREIAETVSQIDTGHLDQQVPHEGGDEVGILAKSINRMTGRLAKYEAMNVEKIQKLNTELTDANIKLEELATRDALTGLWNVRIFHENLNEEILRAHRSGNPLTLIMIDLDHFKTVNDTYGHPAGDAVLKHVANLLKDNVRRIDTAARYGGEEMALILANTETDHGAEVAEKIRLLIGELEIVTEEVTLNRSVE